MSLSVAMEFGSAQAVLVPPGSIEDNNMWLENPAKTVTVGSMAVMAGLLIIAVVISVLSQSF
jgi:hypothetical protein